MPNHCRLTRSLIGGFHLPAPELHRSGLPPGHIEFQTEPVAKIGRRAFQFGSIAPGRESGPIVTDLLGYSGKQQSQTLGIIRLTLGLLFEPAIRFSVAGTGRVKNLLHHGIRSQIAIWRPPIDKPVYGGGNQLPLSPEGLQNVLPAGS